MTVLVIVQRDKNGKPLLPVDNFFERPSSGYYRTLCVVDSNGNTLVDDEGNSIEWREESGSFF